MLLSTHRLLLPFGSQARHCSNRASGLINDTRWRLGRRSVGFRAFQSSASWEDRPWVESMSEPDSKCPRVLSIQSHVVHGYVGNKCAVFPLQLLGFEVDAINSVQFSNHTGYPVFKGSVFDGAHLTALLEGLRTNGLLQGTTHLLTGYIGSVSLLHDVAAVVRTLREANDGVLTYLCDPVLGDEGRLYVPREMIREYCDHILPLASVIVPNQTEAELLAECGPIRSVADGFAACDKLHAAGPHTVIITSSVLPDSGAAPLASSSGSNLSGGSETGSTGAAPGSSSSSSSSSGYVTLMASTTRPQARGPAAQRLILQIPRINAYFTGTGDLVAALLLAWSHHHPDDLATAVEKATAGLQAVLRNTVAACGPAALSAERTSQVCQARELRLIQSQKHLAEPVVTLRCVLVGGQVGAPAARASAVAATAGKA